MINIKSALLSPRCWHSKRMTTRANGFLAMQTRKITSSVTKALNLRSYASYKYNTRLLFQHKENQIECFDIAVHCTETCAIKNWSISFMINKKISCSHILYLITNFQCRPVSVLVCASQNRKIRRTLANRKNERSTGNAGWRKTRVSKLFRSPVSLCYIVSRVLSISFFPPANPPRSANVDHYLGAAYYLRYTQSERERKSYFSPIWDFLVPTWEREQEKQR